MNYYTESAASFWIPASEAGAGSISSEGNIVSGTNTFFTIQLESGDWIVDSSGNSAQVRTVVDDTTLEVYGTSNVSGSLEIVKGDNAKNLFLGVKNKAGADITIDGVTVADGDSKVFGQQNSAGYRRKFVAPKFINNSAEGQILINIERNTNLRRMSSVPFIPGLFDPDYQAVLDYATTQGYTLPSAGQQVLQNQLVLDLKAAGVWSKLDSLTIHATDGDFDYALIDWVRLTTMTAFNAPTFVTNQGFTGNGTSAYIATGFTPSTDAVNLTLNDASFGYHSFGLVNELVYKYGALNSFNNRMFVYYEEFGFVRITSNSTYSAGVVTGTDKLIHINRVDANNVNRYVEGVLNGSGASTSDPNGLTTTELQILSAGNISAFSSENISMTFCGANLTSEAADLNTAYRNYLTSI